MGGLMIYINRSPSPLRPLQGTASFPQAGFWLSIAWAPGVTATHEPGII